MRLFVAVEFDKKTKSYLSEAQKIVEDVSMKGKFTDLDNLHITVKFIGELDEKRVKMLLDILEEVSLNKPKFSITFNKLGSFVKDKKKIVWLGIKESPELRDLSETLENKLEAIDIKKDKRDFKAHITLGRRVELCKELYEVDSLVPKRDFKVNAITLMQSTRVDGILTYIPIKRVELRG